MDALFGFFQQLVAIAELGGARGTDLRARRRLSDRYALAAHDALAHARDGLVPFVFRHAKRTGCHAIAASHAAAFVVSDRAESGLLQRAHRADRGAGRVVAVHAQPAHELVVLGQDNREFVRRSELLVLRFCRRRAGRFRWRRPAHTACSRCRVSHRKGFPCSFDFSPGRPGAGRTSAGRKRRQARAPSGDC